MKKKRISSHRHKERMMRSVQRQQTTQQVLQGQVISSDKTTKDVLPSRTTKIKGLEIVLPERVALRPRDERGYPLLYTTLVREDGQIDFTTNDPQRVLECGINRLCGICGIPIEPGSGPEHDCYPMYFVGGPYSLEYTRVFNDPPMHKECVEFAMGICPWMIAARLVRRKYPDEMMADAQTGAVYVSERPPYLGLMKASDYQFDRPTRLFKASTFSTVIKRWNPRGDAPMPSEDEIRAYMGEAFKALFIRAYDNLKVRQMARHGANVKQAWVTHLMGQLERGEISEEEVNKRIQQLTGEQQ
jgi:hypothetical protein